MACLYTAVHCCCETYAGGTGPLYYATDFCHRPALQGHTVVCSVFTDWFLLSKEDET